VQTSFRPTQNALAKKWSGFVCRCQAGNLRSADTRDIAHVQFHDAIMKKDAMCSDVIKSDGTNVNQTGTTKKDVTTMDSDGAMKQSTTPMAPTQK
jgi:hypothetical protein